MIHYPSFVNLQYGMRIAHLIWQLGVGIILNQCRRFSWIGAGLSLLEAGQSLLGIGQSHHVSDVLSLNPGDLSKCTLSAGRVYGMQRSRAWCGTPS